MKKLLFKLTVVSIVILSTSFGGVTGKISGNVKDSSGQPLPGANIILEGTNRGAAADENGFLSYSMLHLELIVLLLK